MLNRCVRLCVFLLLLPSASRAQAIFDGTGFASGRDTHTVFPYEHVDPLSGNLLLRTTDLSLPGNAGMNLVVQRVYNSKIHPNFENNQDTTLEERSWVGVGWRLHFGRVINPSTATPGSTLIEMSDGSRHPLQTTTHFPEGWMTREFWRYDRAAHTLKLPNGYIYTFDHVAAPNGMLTDVRYVTRIEDAYGNSLVFTYFSAPGPTDGVQTITQDLGGGQSRTVTFTYNATTKMLATMTYDGRTWTYNFLPSNVATHYWLTDVQTPANLTRWHFEYDGTLPGGELKTLVAPSGGLIRVVYATQSRLLNQLSVPTRAVTSRTTEAQGVTLGTWSFAYGQGVNADESVVTTPCNVERYRYLGVGSSGPFNAWRSGLLAERTVAAPGSGTVLEREVLTWGTLEAISPDPIPPVPGGSAGDPAVYPAHLLERTVTRGTQSWRTTFEFHLADGRFNDYGRAYRVRAYDEGTVTYQQAQTTFDYSFLVGTPPPYPYVLPVASVVATLGAETATTAYTYDMLTGFVTTVTTRGRTTTFTRTARGNVASVRDAVRPATTFEYSWGVVRLITPPLGPVTTRSIRPDGLAEWERLGTAPATLTTAYEYDQIGRVTLVTPPGGSGGARWPTFYNYDATHSRTLWVMRGDLANPATHRVQQTDLDDFGRVLRTIDPAGVKVEVAYDACGRTTATSLPFTGATIPGWATSTYDALGRVLTTTTPTTTSTTSTTSWTYPGGDVTVTDPLGRVTSYDYQAFGDPGAARLRALTDPAGQVTTYQYTLAGDLREVRGPGTGPTPAGPVRTWGYDPTSGLLASDTQPESGTTSYTYDAAGLLQTVTVGVGTSSQVTTTLVYDGAGRSQGRDLPGTADDVALTYDALGRVASQTLGAVTTTWGYDPTVGRLTSRSDAVDARTFTSTYVYNAYDDLTTLTYPRTGATGREVTYAIAPTSGRVTGVSATVNGAPAAPFATDFTYDTSGRLTSYKTGQVEHSVEYDLASRPTSIEVGLNESTGANRLDLTYAYNAASEVTAITDQRSAASQTFTYDVLSRLRTATAPGGYGALTWAYDATGNRTQVLRNGAATDYSYHPTTHRLSSTSGAAAETFGYDDLGRVTSDHQGAYTYRPGGTLATVTRTSPAMTATYDYAADGWRLKRTVNGTTSYTLRGLGTQTLSTFDVINGSAVWSRDLIYGAGRLLGAIRSGPSGVSVAFAAAASSVNEGAGTVSVQVTLTTPAPLTWPVTVVWATSNGTATAGADYTTTAGTVRFDIGTATGATRTISVPVVDDTWDEADTETFLLTLSSPVGASLGATATHTVSLQDNDNPPTLSVTCPSVAEDVGIATCTVTPLAASVYDMTAVFATSNGSALLATGDYQALSPFQVSWAPGDMSARSVPITIVNDSWTEPAETVTLGWTATHALPASGSTTLTIQANDGTRVTINPALGGLYLADLDAGPGPDDYLVIANPSATATTARVTYLWANGSGLVQDVAVAANSRQQFYLPTQVGLNGPSSVAVQSLTAGVPLDTEHVQAWNGWYAWRATEGAVPAATWYFAEGNISTFEEYLAIFNPEPVAVSVTATAYRAGLAPTPGTVIIPAGPGRVRLRVRDWLGTVGDHATRLTATRLDTGAPALVVAERTAVWEADQRGGASTPGVSTLATTWHLAEGNKGAFDSYYAIVNPQATAQTVSVIYRHENGFLYTGSLSVGAHGRATFTIPSWIPDGNLGMTVSAPLGIAVERSMYGGTTWTVGHAGVASASAGYTWRFAKGDTGPGADTYFAVVNIGGSPTTATFTFRTTANTTVTATLWLPAQCRATLYANAVPGLSAASFRTTVTASEPIVVERAMYWPGSSGSSSAMASGASEGLGAPAAAPVLVGDPEADAVVDAATLAERQAAFPYVLTPVEPVDAASQARAAGTISPEEQAQLDSVAKARTSFLKKAPPGTQSGVAPPVFLAPTTAASSAVSGEATTTAIALPWHGGFLVLGRLQ